MNWDSAWHAAEHVATMMPLIAAAAVWTIRQLRAARTREMKELSDKSDAMLAVVMQMRDNDMRHVDGKLNDIQAAVTRIETTMLGHLRDHARMGQS
jgi:hypothetical protein